MTEYPDGTKVKTGVVDYVHTTKNGYGPQGNVGVNYTTTKVDEGGNVISRSGFNVKNNFHGVYAGSNNPKKFWEKPNEKGEYPDDYSLAPIDETDASAKQHDLDYDKAGVTGLSGVMDNRSSKANEDFISKADKTNEKYKKGEKDSVTGKPVTKETNDAAQKAAKGFEVAEKIKHIKIEPGPKF